MKDMGEEKEVLGLQINGNRSICSLFLDQFKYAKEILERLAIQTSRPVSRPLEASSKFELELSPESSEPVTYVPYRKLSET